jgi:hypothetical protein
MLFSIDSSSSSEESRDGEGSEGGSEEGTPVECYYSVGKNETEVSCNGVLFAEENVHYDPPGSVAFFIDLGVIAALVLVAGLMSGLTLGLLGVFLFVVVVVVVLPLPLPLFSHLQSLPISLLFFSSLLLLSFLSLLLTLFLGMDPIYLEILTKAGEPTEQGHAKRILPLVSRHHLLLVTLLLTNAGAMEALPIFLDRIVDPLYAVIISVTLVLMFGE